MRSTFYLTTSALVAFASAQLSSKCNPTVNETGSCPDNPAISASFETDFKAGKDAVKGWDIENWSVENYAPNYVAEGVELTVTNKKDVPVLRTQGYFLFGKIEVRMKAAPGAGIVSSVVLASADLDEVDWEWLGGFPDKVQTNYFGKGNATTFDRVTEVPVKNQEFHTYALDWTKEKLDWIIDDKVVRTLKYEDAVGGKNYPQTPCTLGFGPWAAGDSENEGTSQWAGGKVDWSKGPYTQTIEWVKITNYSPGSAYKWKDQSGSWESIEVLDAGNKEGAPVNTETATPSAATSVATEGIGSHPTITSAAEGDKPTETGKEGEQPAETNNPGYGEKPTEAPSTSCSEGEKPTAPPTPEEPCDCDTETTTVTGYPPESTTEVPPPPPTTEAPPPPPETTEVSPPPPQTTETSSCTTSMSVPPPPPPPETTEVSPPPPQTTSEVPPPPPETYAPPPPETTSEVPPPPPETTSEVPPPPPETYAPPPPETTSEVPPPPPETHAPPPPETTEVSPPPPQTTSEVPPPPPETYAPPPPETTSEVPPPPPETYAPPPPETTSEVPPPPETSAPPPPPPETTAEVPPPPATSESTTCTTSTSVPPPPPPSTEVPPPPPTTEVSPPPPQTTSEVPPPPPETTAPPPPPETTAPPPPPETTAEVPPPPATSETSSCTTSTSITITVSNPPSTTGGSPPPPTETPQTTLETSATPPPYPTIKTDTSSYPVPSAPTGAVPTGGNTTSPPVQEFPGAATHNTAGALFGLVGAVMLMAF